MPSRFATVRNSFCRFLWMKKSEKPLIGFQFSMQMFFAIVGQEMQRSVFHSRLARVIAPRLRRVCCAGVLAMAIQGNASEISTANFAPPSSWVKPQFFNQQSTTNLLDSGADQHWLLLERQINALQNETFLHSVRQILTMAGVQNGATLTIDFNPGYQSLTLHWARIWRGAQHLDRLDTNQVKIVQPERELDRVRSERPKIRHSRVGRCSRRRHY